MFYPGSEFDRGPDYARMLQEPGFGAKNEGDLRAIRKATNTNNFGFPIQAQKSASSSNITSWGEREKESVKGQESGESHTN